MLDLIFILGCSILAIMGHLARNRKWLEWIIRIIIGSFCGCELLAAVVTQDSTIPWANQVLYAMAAATGLLLVLPVREIYSKALTVIDGIVSLRCITGPIRHHMNAFKSIMDRDIFVPKSVPHMVGLFIYITTFGMMLQTINPANFNIPAIPFPLPISIIQLFSYNGLGLVLLSFCGVGIFITRDWKAAFKRLGWEKPTWAHVGIGLALIVFSFGFDLAWSLYTHGLADQDLATKLSQYNSGTFSVADGFGMSVFIALCTAIFAGVGEETLIRGALQPAIGILPAAILHGILHAQFAHAPIFIIQVALWSMVMGIARRFTNTTTTIIGHAGFNFVTTFLFAFNP
ncbi:MAG: CPBP family intramembrane glutamic endopeptidase [Cyanobacteriota/Melainabacteria group bacterium]